MFFVLAPGSVAGLVPWWLTDGWTSAASVWYLRVPGAILILGGLAVLVRAFVSFAVEGLGTPAPVVPTQRLVVGGMYRYVRNPMYVAIIVVVLGQALWLAQGVVLLYAGLTWVVPALFVKVYEEPTLARAYGEQYEQYRRNVPAWLPRLTPWHAAGLPHDRG